MIPSEDHSHLPEINPQNIKSATYLIWASRIENHWFKEALHNTHTHTHTHTQWNQKNKTQTKWEVWEGHGKCEKEPNKFWSWINFKNELIKKCNKKWINKKCNKEHQQ